MIDRADFPRFHSQIKSKNPKRIKARRLKLPGRIRELAAKDIQAAKMMALRGKQFTKIETLLYLYFRILEQLRRAESRTTADLKTLQKTEPLWTKENLGEYQAETQKLLEGQTLEIQRVFMEAINAHDSKKIFEIGTAVAFLKKYTSHDGDMWRAIILDLKIKLDRKGQKWPIREVAKAVGLPDMHGKDGFKTIRRICKELRFPLAESKRKADKPK